jgi:hypothetical protein
MIIAALRKAIAQLALGNLMQGWAAPETDLLCEAGLLPPDSRAKDRAVNSYCLPPSLSSHEIAERALWYAAKSLGEDRKGLERESARVRLVPTADGIPAAEGRVPNFLSQDDVVGVRNKQGS